MNGKTGGLLALILAISLLISGCGTGQLFGPAPVPSPTPLPAGVVTGSLFGSDGRPFGKGVQVIPSARDDVNQQCMFSNDLIQKSVDTDKTGAFILSNLPPGKYCLMLDSGGVMGLVLSADKHSFFTFEVSGTAGLDLGKISAGDLKIP